MTGSRPRSVKLNAGLAWWCCVVFVLFNSCASHRVYREVARALKSGEWSPSIGFAIDAIRAVGTDDGDIERYLAYANAILGRPYPAYYVRPTEGWRVDDLANDRDASPVATSRPLTPYRDFSVEYPPGFLPIALVPALAFHDLDAYALAFSILMGLALTLSLWLAVRVARKIELPVDRLVVLAAGSALALGMISVRRYDAVVSLSAMAVVWGIVEGRPVIAGIALGFGVAAKGVPLLLAPFAVIELLARRRSRDAAVMIAAAVAVVAVAVVPFVTAPLFDLVRYHGERPLQIESTWGALLLVAKPLVGATTLQTFGSLNVVAGIDGPLRTLASLLPPLAWLALIVYAVRSPRDDTRIIRLFPVALVAYMVLGKVFSPQYVTWLLPIGALASFTAGRVDRVLFVLALALTQLIYPFLYLAPSVWEGSSLFGVVVLARNGVLAAWAVRLLLVAPRRSEPSAPAA